MKMMMDSGRMWVTRTRNRVRKSWSTGSSSGTLSGLILILMKIRSR